MNSSPKYSQSRAKGILQGRQMAASPKKTVFFLLALVLTIHLSYFFLSLWRKLRSGDPAPFNTLEELLSHRRQKWKDPVPRVRSKFSVIMDETASFQLPQEVDDGSLSVVYKPLKKWRMGKHKAKNSKSKKDKGKNIPGKVLAGKSAKKFKKDSDEYFSEEVIEENDIIDDPVTLGGSNVPHVNPLPEGSISVTDLTVNGDQGNGEEKDRDLSGGLKSGLNGELQKEGDFIQNENEGGKEISVGTQEADSTAMDLSLTGGSADEDRPQRTVGGGTGNASEALSDDVGKLSSNAEELNPQKSDFMETVPINEADKALVASRTSLNSSTASRNVSSSAEQSDAEFTEADKEGAILLARKIGASDVTADEETEDEVDRVVNEATSQRRRVLLSPNTYLRSDSPWDEESGDLRTVHRIGSPPFIDKPSSEEKWVESDRGNGGWEGPIPLLTIFAKPTKRRCGKTNFVYKSLKQALKHNSLVHFIGPRSCSHLRSEGISWEDWVSYQPILNAFRAEIGVPKPKHVRWYVLREFMRRHKYKQVFYFEPDISVFANITDAVNQLLEPEERHIMLLHRLPSLTGTLTQTPATTSAPGHTSLWSRAGLEDFLKFHRFFFQMDVLNGRPITRFLVELPDYSDDVILGWYAYHSCWMNPESVKCTAEVNVGMNPERIHRIQGQFSPLYKVSSGVKPRMCKASVWSERGWCVFDEGLVVATMEGQRKLPLVRRPVQFRDWYGRHPHGSDKVQLMTARVQKRTAWFL